MPHQGLGLNGEIGFLWIQRGKVAFSLESRCARLLTIGDTCNCVEFLPQGDARRNTEIVFVESWLHFSTKITVYFSAPHETET